MNDDEFTIDAEEQLRSRLVAMLMGEVEADEATQLREVLKQRPDLQEFVEETEATMDHLRQTIGSVQETAPPAARLRLSADRRRHLEVLFAREETCPPSIGMAWWVMAAAVLMLFAGAGFWLIQSLGPGEFDHLTAPNEVDYELAFAEPGQNEPVDFQKEVPPSVLEESLEDSAVTLGRRARSLSLALEEQPVLRETQTDVFPEGLTEIEEGSEWSRWFFRAEPPAAWSASPEESFPDTFFAYPEEPFSGLRFRHQFGDEIPEDAVPLDQADVLAEPDAETARAGEIAVYGFLEETTLPQANFSGMALAEALELLTSLSAEYGAVDGRNITFEIDPQDEEKGELEVFLSVRNMKVSRVLDFMLEPFGLRWRVQAESVIIFLPEQDLPASEE